MPVEVDPPYPHICCRGDDGRGSECWERDGCLRYLQRFTDDPCAHLVSTLRRPYQAKSTPCAERIEAAAQ